jgi:hypothetical protein
MPPFIEENYYKSLSEGNPFNINHNTLISQMQTITGNYNRNVNVSRSITRLKSVFASLIKSLSGASTQTRFDQEEQHLQTRTAVDETILFSRIQLALAGKIYLFFLSLNLFQTKDIAKSA